MPKPRQMTSVRVREVVERWWRFETGPSASRTRYLRQNALKVFLVSVSVKDRVYRPLTVWVEYNRGVDGCCNGCRLRVGSRFNATGLVAPHPAGGLYTGPLHHDLHPPSTLFLHCRFTTTTTSGRMFRCGSNEKVSAQITYS